MKNEGASAPAPVELDASEADVALMWRAVRRQNHGIGQPWSFWLGVLEVLWSLYGLSTHHGFQWWILLVGLAFIALSFQPSQASALRARELRFSDSGLVVAVANALPFERQYPWQAIARIDDLGDAFVLVPPPFRFGKRVVFPKRSFPDGGREAWAFFAANHVAGRTPLAPVARA